MDRSKWEYKKLGDICEKGSSNIAQNKIEDNTGDYALYGASGYVKSIDFYHQEQPYIGVVKDGSGVGRVNKYPAKSSLLGTMQYIYPKNGCDLGYLLYVLQGLHLEKYKTGAAIPHIYFKDYCKCEVPFPSLFDQQRIVAELDCLNEMIAVKQEQLKEFDKLAQSIFYDMFGDPVSNEKGWDIIELGTKCEVTSFKRVLIEEVVDSGIPFIRGTELMALSKATKGEQIDFSLFITPEHYERVKTISGVPKVGDLLIPSINSDGNIWILDTDEPRYYKDGRVLWVHVNHDAFSSEALKYIMHILLKKTYSLMATGATFAELKLFVLRELKVPLPPLALQQQFADKISAIEAQKELVKQSIAETQHLLDYTMDKYFG